MRNTTLFQSLPDAVSVYEVSPRDGLQNEAAQVSTYNKTRLVDALTDAGVARIEVTSFVSPRWIPQLSDAEELVKQVHRPATSRFSALCPNRQGLDRAIVCGIGEVAVFLSVSESHNKRNVNKSVAESLLGFRDVVQPAVERGLRARAYLSTLWGCPYEGDVDPKRGVEITRQLLDLGCYEVSLSDTIGVGTPRQTMRILEMFLDEFPANKLAMHMHDTRGTALSNVVVGLEMGIRTFDASVGGLGGCPYAPGAAGNLATEDLVYTLHGMGIQTGIDLERLVEAGRVASAIVGRDLPGKVLRAGVRSLRR
jgi:hydroxymethylglutaryl-CoA lyase